MPAPSRKATILFLAALVCGLAARLWLASLGGNFDLMSWVLIARGMDDRHAIYTSLGRYNYGPVWAWILHGLAHLTPVLFGGATSVLRFHMVIAGFLGLVDAAIAWIVSRIYGTTAAIVFILCPISVLISGFHSQFDNLAVLLGLLAWLILRDPALRKQSMAFWAAAVFVGLSLATKHILIFLPIWILLWSECGDLRRRLGFCAVAYGIFIAGFVPWLLDPASRPYVIANVFAYTSAPQYSFLRRLAAFCAPWLLSTYAPFPGLTVVNLVWAAAMVSLGAIAIRVQARDARPEIYMIYLAALVPFAPSAAVQYLAIPLLAGGGRLAQTGVLVIHGCWQHIRILRRYEHRRTACRAWSGFNAICLQAQLPWCAFYDYPVSCDRIVRRRTSKEPSWIRGRASIQHESIVETSGREGSQGAVTARNMGNGADTRGVGKAARGARLGIRRGSVHR